MGSVSIFLFLCMLNNFQLYSGLHGLYAAKTILFYPSQKKYACTEECFPFLPGDSIKSCVYTEVCFKCVIGMVLYYVGVDPGEVQDIL